MTGTGIVKGVGKGPGLRTGRRSVERFTELAQNAREWPMP
jgi:hypothetical protein